MNLKWLLFRIYQCNYNVKTGEGDLTKTSRKRPRRSKKSPIFQNSCAWTAIWSCVDKLINFPPVCKGISHLLENVSWQPNCPGKIYASYQIFYTFCYTLSCVDSWRTDNRNYLLPVLKKYSPTKKIPREDDTNNEFLLLKIYQQIFLLGIHMKLRNNY